MTDGRPGQENGLRGGLPSPALPGSGPWGRRAACQLPGLSAFPPGLRVSPALGSVQLPRSPRRRNSGCRAPWRAPRDESPDMHGPNDMAPAHVTAAIRPPGPVPCTTFPAAVSGVENRSISRQPPVSLRATPYRRENSGGTARDVVLTLVRLRPPVSLTPGAGHPRGRSLCARARGSVSSARPRFPGRYRLAG